MKGILLLTLFTMLAYGNSCPRLEQEIIVLENQIQSSKLPACSTENNVFCCREDELDSCLAHSDVELRYNDAMAKLVLYEGLLALGQSIEDNHKVIEHMSVYKINEAKNSIEDFFDSVNKAELINNSLQLNGDTGLLIEYKGTQPDDLETYLNGVCQNQTYVKFCNSYNRILGEYPAKKYEYLESLHGFAVADRNMLDNNKRRDYEKYKDYLTISIDGKDVSYDNISQHPQYNSLKLLRNKLEELPSSSGGSVPSEILALTKNLNTVEVSFDEGIDVKSRFEDFITEDVKKGIAGLNQTTQLLLGSKDYKNNLEKLSATFSKQQRSHTSTLKSEIRDFIETTPNLSCNNGESEVSCLVRLCDPQTLEESCNNTQIGLSDLYRHKKKVDDLNETKEMIESTKVCLEQESLDAQEQCVLAMKADLFDIANDKVEELRSELAYVEQIRHNMNRGKPFVDLQKEKALVLMAFKNLGCMNNDNLSTLSDLESSCSIPDIDTFAQTSLELKSDVDEIMINLSMQPHLNDELSMDGNLYKAYREDFIEKCNSDDSESSSLCRYFKDAFAKEEAEAARRAAADNSYDNLHSLLYNRPGIGETTKVDTSNDPGNITGGDIAVAAAYTGVQLLPGFIQLGYMKQNHEYRMNAGVTQLNNMYRQRDYYNWYATNYQNVNLQNYGWNYYDSYRPIGFGGGNTDGIYYSPYDYSQLSFASPQMMSPSTFDFSTTSTSASSNVSTVGFSFP